MWNMRVQRTSLIVVTALLLTACTPSNVQTPTPPAQLATSAPAPTVAPALTVAPAPTEGTLPTAPASPEPTAGMGTFAPQIAKGEVVLTLTAGTRSNQVGISGTGDDVSGPRAFRIGSDGSLRLLDTLNNRILFFTKDGKPARTLAINGVTQVTDFIINNNGEAFVLATLDAGQPTILHYNQAGAVVEQIALNGMIGNSADGIMLTAQGWLMLVQGNTRSWVIRHDAIDTPPNLQALTERNVVPTPRSPALFNSTFDATGAPDLRIFGPNGDALVQTMALAPESPKTTSFFNVDRAMNLYTASDFTQPQVDLYRLAPEGNVLGAARIDTSGCGSTLRSWRSYYIDQVGAAWALCVTAEQATLTRYTLINEQGQPLPEAAPTPADVAWKPGANFSAA